MLATVKSCVRRSFPARAATATAPAKPASSSLQVVLAVPDMPDVAATVGFSAEQIRTGMTDGWLNQLGLSREQVKTVENLSALVQDRTVSIHYQEPTETYDGKWELDTAASPAQFAATLPAGF